MNRHCYGLILAGGRGTRFWPRSRRRSAKQVLNVVGERSLIQATVDRLTPVIPPERIWILTNHHLRDAIVAQLPSVPKAQVLAEPRSATRRRRSAWRRRFCARSTRMP
jgi:mannose-1-phosphate guanylyltransferase